MIPGWLKDEWRRSSGSTFCLLFVRLGIRIPAAERQLGVSHTINDLIDSRPSPAANFRSRCNMADDRSKVLESAIAQIEKQYGKGAIMRLGNRDVLVPVSVIPSGAVSLDAALGVGGFPRGRVIEIFGPESGGKTTMTLHVIAQAQKLGGQAAFIDAEHALDPAYARKL